MGVSMRRMQIKALWTWATLSGIFGLGRSATQALTRIISLDGADADAYAWRSSMYKRMGNSDGALADISRAIELAPKNTDFHYKRAMLFIARKEKDKAIDDFSRTISVDPNCGPAYLNRGIVYGELRIFDKAIEDFSKAIMIQPGRAEAWHLRGVAHSENDDNDKAISDYDQALRLNPRMAAATKDRTLALESKQRVAMSSQEFVEGLYPVIMGADAIAMFDGHDGKELLSTAERAFLLAAHFYNLLGKRGLQRAQKALVSTFVTHLKARDSSKAGSLEELEARVQSKILEINAYFKNLPTNLSPQPSEFFKNDFVVGKNLDFMQKTTVLAMYIAEAKVIDAVFEMAYKKVRVSDS